MSTLDHLFLDHPASVDETYAEHLSTACGFGGRMMVAGLLCFIHGLIPGLFTHAASDRIRGLVRDMDSRRPTGSRIDLGAGVIGPG
jgi:hypothetical protein